MSKLSRAERHIKTKIDKSKRILKLFYDRNDLELSIADCLADMMHLAAELGSDFSESVSLAALHYTAEHAESISNDSADYDAYYNSCETANKIPLTFDGWRITKR